MKLQVQTLTSEVFAPFGDVIEARGQPDKWINAGRCGRHHNLAALDFAAEGRAGISIFRSQAISLPHDLDLVERHPLGSQCFIPMSCSSYLVVVAQDDRGSPINLKAFVAGPNQSVNYHRNIWHGVLMPLGDEADFAVVDWIGEAANLEEFKFQSPVRIET